MVDKSLTAIEGTAEFNRLRSIERSRTKHNMGLALELARAGLAVFPASSGDKRPLIPSFQHLDDAMPVEQREEVIAEFRKEKGHTPAHVGATKHAEVIRKLWGMFRGAVPAISCGPSGLLVIDADEKHGGPKKIRDYFASHGGIPTSAPVTHTQGGGIHIYLENGSRLGCRAGALKRLYGCDVKGAGGYVIAPGAVREDGKRYRPDDSHVKLQDAFKHQTLPVVPSFILDAIGTASEQNDNVTHLREREVVQILSDSDWSEYENDFEPGLGDYDLEQIKTSNPEFAKLYDHPSVDCSTNRFKATQALLTEWPDMPVVSLAVFLRDWVEGAGVYIEDGQPRTGEFDDRQIAREWLKNQGRSKPSNGDAFEPVDDEADEDTIEGDSKDERNSRVSYLEDIRAADTKFIEWVVKHVIARGTTGIVSGRWGAGKTAVFMDIALHVASGIQWRGRKVTKGVVLYCGLENPEDVSRRVRAWCELMEEKGHDLSSCAFVQHRGPLSLVDLNGRLTRDAKEVIDTAREASEHYGLPVAMIVIDTVSQSIGPGNVKEHAAFYTTALSRISRATGAHVVGLHHPTKAGDLASGGLEFQANTDTVILIERDKHQVGTIKGTDKFRIGDPKLVDFTYTLRPRKIGEDIDGDDLNVVLAYPPRDAGGTDIGVVDDEEEVPLAKRADSREDRVSLFVELMREMAGREAAQGEPLHEVRLVLPAIEREYNARRPQFCSLEGKPLKPLNREGVKRIAIAATEAGSIVRRGGAYYLRPEANE